MGMFDTIVFQKPIFCECGTKIESTQIKEFDNALEIYRVGDLVNSSLTMSIIQEQSFCDNCNKYSTIYIAIKYGIYLGVFDSYGDARKKIELFDTMDLLNYYTKSQQTKSLISPKNFMESIVEHFDDKKENNFIYNSYFKNAKTPIDAIRNYLKESELEDAIRSTHSEKSEFEITYKKENDRIIIYNTMVQKYLSSSSVFTIIQSLEDEEIERFDYNLGEIVVQSIKSQNIITDEIQKWLDIKNLPLKCVTTIDT